MTKTTKAQRHALKRVFDRVPLVMVELPRGVMPMPTDAWGPRLSYRQWRAMAQPTFGMDNAIVIPWCGMWLAIETDGYTHS